MDLKKLKAPFIPKEIIHKKADAFREKYWKKNPPPVDILKIAEFNLNIDIEPFDGLKSSYDMDALISTSLNTIIIDKEQLLDPRMDNRLRFSIAHEIGHLILHGEIFKNLDFDSPEEWISNYSEIPEKTYSSIEYHAYEFAGRLLVPREALIKEIGKVVEISKKLHLDKIGISGPRLLGYASPKIAKVFGVSDAVIEKRFIYEELQDYLK